MNLATKALLLLLILSATFAVAQIQYKQPPPFSHIVIIFQENRTPDNLFGANPGNGATCGQPDPFEPGVDIDNGGPNLASEKNGDPYITCLTLNPGLITGGGCHNHLAGPGCLNQGWEVQCDYSSSTQQCQMDGACLGTWPTCNQYQYVAKAAVKPYFDIATNYGFANYMFSTHEGPSFPAHQFILGGTSAPVWPGDPQQFYKYFVAEQPSSGLAGTGCPATGSRGWPEWVDPTGLNEIPDPNESECYDRNTLVTYQNSAGHVYDRTALWSSVPQPAWKYYVPVQNVGLNEVWNAPKADPQICYFATSGSGNCTSNEYSTHVSVAQTRHMASAPILTDIQDCQLPAISWVIPDERWSDHPGSSYELGLGPSWVADIVDAIGQSYQNSGGVCDYWGYGTGSTNPEPTAIFITWDDWGGFFDHVQPPAVYIGTGSYGNWTCPQTPNGWGCGYVYGFRVPLLVVSEYTQPATISGAIPSPGAKYFQHDFGSILAFIENNFTQQGLPLPPIAPSPYTYADQNTLDATYNGSPAVPLWDFFLGPQRDFTYIFPLQDTQGANFFMNYYESQNASPIGPENGDPED